MTPDHHVVRTERLEMIWWTLALIDALIANGQAAAEKALAIRFPEPFAPPPETGDVLEFFRRAAASDTSGGLFGSRMIVRAADRMALGSIGCMAPGDDGASFFGYSVYPEFEGQGYASEAAKGLVDYVLAQGVAESVIATIAVGHVASGKVASRAGLTPTGEIQHEDGVDLNVWQRHRM